MILSLRSPVRTETKHCGNDFNFIKIHFVIFSASLVFPLRFDCFVSVSVSVSSSHSIRWDPSLIFNGVDSKYRNPLFFIHFQFSPWKILSSFFVLNPKQYQLCISTNIVIPVSLSGSRNENFKNIFIPFEKHFPVLLWALPLRLGEEAFKHLYIFKLLLGELTSNWNANRRL